MITASYIRRLKLRGTSWLLLDGPWRMLRLPISDQRWAWANWQRHTPSCQYSVTKWRDLTWVIDGCCVIINSSTKTHSMTHRLPASMHTCKRMVIGLMGRSSRHSFMYLTKVHANECTVNHCLSCLFQNANSKPEKIEFGIEWERWCD